MSTSRPPYQSMLESTGPSGSRCAATMRITIRTVAWTTSLTMTTQWRRKRMTRRSVGRTYSSTSRGASTAPSPPAPGGTTAQRNPSGSREGPPAGRGPPGRRRRGSALLRHRTVRLLGREGGLGRPGDRALGDHHLAPVDADDDAVLVVADGLDGHDAAVVLGARLLLVQPRRLAVDRVAVEDRLHVAERLDLEVRDRLARDVGDRHAEQQRVDVVPDDDVASLLGALGVVAVEVQRVVVHRDEAEEVVVLVGDRP